MQGVLIRFYIWFYMQDDLKTRQSENACKPEVCLGMPLAADRVKDMPAIPSDSVLVSGICPISISGLTSELKRRDDSIAIPKHGQKRKKSMSRRKGQRGTVVRKGDVWHLRYSEDIPEKDQPVRRSVFVGKAVGADKLTKSEARRHADEIIRKSGVNTEEHFNRVCAVETGETFRQQAQLWLRKAEHRNRKPVKASTLSNWKYQLEKWVLPELGDLHLADVKNSAMKHLVEKLVSAKLSPGSIQNICQIPKLVLASCVNDEGERVYQYKFNAEFIDAPAVRNQRRPVFTSEQVFKIVETAEGKYKMLFALLAGTGLRAGEALGLEIGKHISDDCSLIRIRQNLWRIQIQSPKTENAIRDIDVHPALAEMLKQFIGDRKDGFLFQNCVGGFPLQTNILRRHLHPLLKKLGVEKTGLHAFRRFRVTHLRRMHTPGDLIRYWVGHAKADITDVYSKLEDDLVFRKQCAVEAGLGFQLLNCPNNCPTAEIPEQQIAA